MVRLTFAEQRRIRRLKRRGSILRDLRKELRALDNSTLLNRLARYTGRTMTEEKRRAWSWANGVDRESVIDKIINYEVE